MESQFLQLIVPLAIVALAVGIAVVLTKKWRRQAREILDHWARKNDLTVLEARPKPLGGRFFPRANARQVVFALEVRHQDDSVRTGQVRIGDYWRGMNYPRMTFRWDDEPEEQYVDPREDEGFGTERGPGLVK